jgi:hypothetical protein
MVVPNCQRRCASVCPTLASHITVDIVCAKRIWHVENDDARADLLFRASLPGASGYDHAVHTMRVLRGSGAACIDLLPLALPTSWMVNAKATSHTFQAWLKPDLSAVWARLFDLMPSGLSVDGWETVSESTRMEIAQTVQALAAIEGANLAAISKVLALLRPELVPLMDDAAVWFALDAVPEPTSADLPRAPVAHFVPMLDWFCQSVRAHEPALIALAVAHTEHVYDAPQVLDRLLWVASWGRRLRAD